MATIAPIPSNNTSSTKAVTDSTSPSPQTTAPQDAATTAKGNLSTAMVQSTSLPASTPVNAPTTTYALNNSAPVQTATSSIESQPPLTPDNIKNILGFLMTVMADLGIAIRKANMESRQLDLQNQVNALLSQVQNMRDAAEKSRSSALATAIAGIVMGAVSTMAGSYGLSKSFSAKSDLKDMAASAQPANKPADNAAANPVGNRQSVNVPDEVNVSQPNAVVNRQTANFGDEANLNVNQPAPVANRQSGNLPDEGNLNVNQPNAAPSGRNDQFDTFKAQADSKTGIGTGATQLGNAINALGNSIGSIFGATEKYAADMASALAQQFAALATELGATYEQSNTFAANALQALNGALQTVKSMSDTELNTSLNIIRNTQG